jgi:hypothetical protein
MGSYTLREPHPTVAQNSYTHSGRGGAGNFFRAPVTTPSAGVATTYSPATTSSSSSSSSSSSAGRFYSGRGGAGNAHKVAERHVMSFDEEYALADAVERKQSAGHIGRGGAGNVYGSSSALSKKDRKHSQGAASDTSSRRDSTSTTGSERQSGFWGRLSGTSLRH